MNPLRAAVTNREGWWEIRLLDFNIAADGASEGEMLEHIRNAIIDEYRLAIRRGRVPFVNIRLKAERKDCRHWNDNGKKLKHLDLPDDVRLALSSALEQELITDFGIKDVA
jgi:hypothetical protein